MPRRSVNSGRDRSETRAAVSLPVLGAVGDKQKIRPSKYAPRRAIVLAVVQLLILAHIVQWIVMGATTTPIEPSEAMEFSKRGVVNAGLIFFVLALLSTLALGRWFCGWGCHVVLLQDLCGWMMKKAGIRPKPFRSRLLMWVPLLLGLYMFVWPAFYRAVILPWLDAPAGAWRVQLELTTQNFWATFPGLMVAIPFLLVCGFATVYFLGSKGFCTYGCPYGGFFAPLDEYSPARIRVTDACDQSGHCTAVCSSNVRVHDEVREYGMVVDPGCMKCLDCVSVCPNDALYFGFGKSAAAKGKPKNEAPKRKFDLTMREEIAFAVVFAAVFFAFRGDYARFPLLMAAGVAIVMTWIIWKAWRLTREDNARLHGFQLKLRGTTKPAGWVLSAGATLIAIAVVHSGLINAATAVAGWYDGKVRVPEHAIFAADRSQVTEIDIASARSGLVWYSRAHALAGSERTLSRSWREGLHLRMAWLHLVTGDFDRSEDSLRQVADTATGEMRLHIARSLGMVLAAQPHRADDALTWYRHALAEQPLENPGIMLDHFMAWADQFDRTADAFDVLSSRLAQLPDDAHTMRWLALLLLDRGEISEGVAMLNRAVDANPDDAAARDLLRMARERLGRGR